MRITNTVVPLLAGLGLAEAQGINFNVLYKAKPALKTATQSTSSTTKVIRTKVAASIVSVLRSKHNATKVKKTTATSTASSSTITVTPSTSASVSSSSASSSSGSASSSSGSASSSSESASSSSATASASSSTSTESRSLSTSTSTVSSTTLSTGTESESSSASVTGQAKRDVTSSSTSTSAATTCTNSNTILYGYTPTPNIPAQFIIDGSLNKYAAAQYYPPAGYSTTFMNAYGSIEGSGYIGYYQLASYNTSACAAICDSVDVCQSFNIYYERTPTFIPDDSCPNPVAAASVTCALWAGPIAATQATNIGQFKKDFMVVIQGSNGYTLNTPPTTVTNFNGPTALDGGVNVNTIGTTTVFLKSYAYAKYDVTTCSKQCTTITANNKAAAVSSGATSYAPCNYFNVMNITLNGVYQAMYCQLYTTSAVASYDDARYATSGTTTYNLTGSYGYDLYPQDPGSTSYTWTAAPTNQTCLGLGAAKSSYIDVNAVNYTLGCGYDVQYSNDIGNQTSSTFYGCFNLCDNFSGCNGFAYLDQTCYFKNLAGSSRTPQLNNYNVDMAWQPSAYAGFSASTIATTVTFTTRTTGWSSTTTGTTTQVINGAGTVIVQTPGVVAATTTTYVTTGVDSGTATTISSTTITPTSGGLTGTVKYIYPTPVTTCSNAGATWAGYSNTFAGNQLTSSYPAYKPEAYKTKSPLWSGKTNYISEKNANNGAAVVYGQSLTSAQAAVLVLNHVFYVFAGRGTGYYSLTIPYTDDATLVWQGPNALSGYTRDNANLQSYYSAPRSITIAFFLTANTYTPFRVQWANGAGAGELQFFLNAPDGSAILASNGNAGTMSPDIVAFPCNSALGAKPSAFGSET